MSFSLRVGLAITAGALATLLTSPDTLAATHASHSHIAEYTIVTSEIKSKPKGIQEIEVYRFDPGVVIAHLGDEVILHFYGVNGSVHPITIAAFGARTVVRRGEVATVKFKASRLGSFPIVCEIHRSKEQHGPMIGTLVVLP